MSLRQQLAFMFVDMRGFGAAVEGLPDEAVLEVLDAYEGGVRAQAGRHGGRVVNFVGDGAFVVFDGAADAIRCAVEIQRAQGGARVAGRSPLPVAIGIHAGKAIPRRGDYIGAAVNQAAHLQMRAHAGEIIVSWEARLAAGALAEIGYEPVPEIAPQFTGAARVTAEGLPSPEAAGRSGEPALPTDREYLLELLFTLEDRLRASSREQTFLSIDVAGSTGMKEGEDPLAIEYSFRGYHHFVTRVVHDHGGKVYSTSGDGVLAGFDRAEDAARAAAALQTQLPTLNDATNRVRRPFRLRCGINTGDVPLHEDVGSAHLFSRVIDTAANIQEAGVPGEVWISESSAEGARRALGPLRTVPDPIDDVCVYAWPGGTQPGGI